MRRIFVFGDSHTRAILQAAEIASCDDVSIDVHWMRTEKDGKVQGDLDYEDAKAVASSLEPTDLMAISLLGTRHNLVGLLRHEQPFTVHGTDGAPCSDEGELIPRAVMEDVFAAASQKNKRIAELRNLSRAPVYHLVTPPPKGDNDYLKSRIMSKVAGEFDVSPAALRLALWQLEMQAVKRVCEGWNVLLLPAHPQAFDEHGFLKHEYYASDATHANRAYGALVLEQLRGVLNAGEKIG
jgi:hypothetical protein